VSQDTGDPTSTSTSSGAPESGLHGGAARAARRDLIRAIQAARGSKVITYVTSDRPTLSAHISEDVVPIIHEHLLAFAPAEREKLDLVIYSRGGDSDVPWSLVSMIREYCREGSFSVLVPYRAQSAATVICLGADEIVMTKKAELGPIDVTIVSGPYNPSEENRRLPVSVEDVTGYFTLLETIGSTRPEEKLRAFEQLTTKVHPLVLGSVSRLLQQTQLVALGLLGTRATPFAEAKNQEIVRKLSSEIYSHRHTITRTEARTYLGLDQVVDAEAAGVDTSLWDLYRSYRELFSFEVPFAPEEALVAAESDERTWSSLPFVCIESENRVDLRIADMRVRRIRQVPPQVALNLQLGNITPPAINIPALPAGLDPAAIAQLVRQIVQPTIQAMLQPLIQQATNDAAEQLRKSLPSRGFERTLINQRWDSGE
jgi:hypothetical protein